MATATKIQFGDGLGVTDLGSGVIRVDAGGAVVGGGHTIQDEGVSLAPEPNLNFVGAGVLAYDDAANGRTVISIPGSSAAPLAPTLAHAVSVANIYNPAASYYTFMPDWASSGVTKNTLGATFGTYNSYYAPPNSVIGLGLAAAWYQIEAEWTFILSTALTQETGCLIQCQGICDSAGGGWTQGAAPLRPMDDNAGAIGPVFRTKTMEAGGGHPRYRAHVATTRYLSNSYGWTGVTNLGLLVSLQLFDNITSTIDQIFCRVDIKRLQTGL